MKIATKKGDSGWTRLCFNRRVRKDNPRLHACGTLDELASFLGLAKRKVRKKRIKEMIHSIQEDIILLCSELATLPRDLRKLERRVDRAMVERLEERIEKLERKTKLRGCRLIIPGETETSALLDICRCIARRAERWVASLRSRKAVASPLILKYVNRLSDLLYLLARTEEETHTRSVRKKRS